MLCLRLALPFLFALLVLCVTAPRALKASPEATERARKFLAAHEAKLRPLELRANQAWWDANISGKAEDFKRKEEAQNRIDEALVDAKAFQEIKNIKDQGQIDDPIVARCIEVIYLTYLEKQVDRALLKRMVAKSNAVEKAFNEFRAKVDGREMTD